MYTVLELSAYSCCVYLEVFGQMGNARVGDCIIAKVKMMDLCKGCERLRQHLKVLGTTTTIATITASRITDISSFIRFCYCKRCRFA